jgi:DNA repair protein RecN (Recombination protein N)
MLKKLIIQNYVIIDRLEIDFSDSLNIITGETGSGKSMLLGALSLVLGQRVDNKPLFDASKKCIIEASFDIKKLSLREFFEENELDYEPVTVIRREITETGKSRAFVNDTPVNLNVLRQLGEQLVNVHSQHETLSLNDAAFQTKLLDGVAKNEQLLDEFLLLYRQYLTEAKKLNQLKTEYQQYGGDTEYLTYQLKELKDANLKPDEQEQLEQEQKILEHAEEIKSNLSKAAYLLQESNQSVTTQLLHISELLEQLTKYRPDIAELAARVESAYLELKDIADSITQMANNTMLDHERLEEVALRLNTIYRLHKKHKTLKTEELIIIQNTLEEKLIKLERHEEWVQQAEKSLQKIKNQLLSLAEKLHHNRLKAIPDIINKVKEGLRNLGMPNATFTIDIEQQQFEKINYSGLDKIRFLFSANKGIDADELRKVASGGELSRLMLILKSLAAEHTALPTLIFDEIDAGISGETADKVGQQMQQLAQHHQVIVITHLPQIASKGDCHFIVYKDESGNKSIARIKKLNQKERVEEIAKMLFGEKISEKAIISAQELLHR